ncbi:CapA family protein [Haladaptatus sp. GCM10025707]|uniref:CapA family protein n=1 Tax=unclassified Haladaptatus TaxID=2622732 RepID=UPI0023E88543|nr:MULTISPECIES: CapA family protein [unclassified Haladaptatus]
MSEQSTLSVSDATGDEPTWSLFVAGDCCLDEQATDRRLLTPALESRVRAADCAVVNLEAPIPTDGEPIPKSGPALTTASETPALLGESGFDVATLANNHSFDYGPEGVFETIAACEEAGLATVGAGEDASDALAPVRTTVAGSVDLAVFSVCEREFGVAGAETPGTAWSDHPAIDDAIRDAAETADVVVVLGHGGVEYVPFSPPARRSRLRDFVDAGADLVVGHHPHVAQGWERYEDGLVFHSLGNFLFDRQAAGETTGWGLALDVEFAGDAIATVELVPTEVEDGIVADLGANRSRAAHLDYLHRLAACTADDDRFSAYWQSVAHRLFYERYWNWLRPGFDEDRLREIDGGRDGSRDDGAATNDREELLALLNVVRNESHRAVVTTALSLMTDERPDHRTKETTTTVEELLTWTMRDEP